MARPVYGNPLRQGDDEVRSVRGGRYGGDNSGYGGRGLNSDIGNIATEVKSCRGGY